MPQHLDDHIMKCILLCGEHHVAGQLYCERALIWWLWCVLWVKASAFCPQWERSVEPFCIKYYIPFEGLFPICMDMYALKAWLPQYGNKITFVKRMSYENILRPCCCLWHDCFYMAKANLWKNARDWWALPLNLWFCIHVFFLFYNFVNCCVSAQRLSVNSSTFIMFYYNGHVMLINGSND